MQSLLSPMRERRAMWEGRLPEVYELLIKGSEIAAETAQGTLDKVRHLRRYAIQQGREVNIEVDGGIGAENALYCTEAGANILVSGSALFKSRHPKAAIQKMREAYREHPFLG